MAYAERMFSCPDCGKPHRKRAPAGSVNRCHPCNIVYAADVARQMHEKSGPAYQRWVMANLAAARKVARTDAVVRESAAS